MISFKVDDPDPEGTVIILVTTPMGNVKIVTSGEGIVAHIEDHDGVRITSMWASHEDIVGAIN